MLVGVFSGTCTIFLKCSCDQKHHKNKGQAGTYFSALQSLTFQLHVDFHCPCIALDMGTENTFEPNELTRQDGGHCSIA